MGRDSPLCESLREQIVQRYSDKVPQRNIAVVRYLLFNSIISLSLKGTKLKKIKVIIGWLFCLSPNYMKTDTTL